MRLLRIFALIALCLAFTPTSAQAVTGYDSAYSGESAFVNIDPGQTQSFQVFFSNTGTVTWATGTDTQVDLAACLEDKVTCNAQDPGEALWNSGWISTARYATTTQATVAPGSLGTFSYNIKAPSNATGTHRFNGDLVVASSGVRIHPQGYYQDATVNAVGSVAVPTPTPTPGSTPFPSAPPPQPTPAPTPTPLVLRAEAGTFDPDNTDACTAGWIVGAPAQGEVLQLTKTGPTSTNCSSGAEITVNHNHFTSAITELGFDYKSDGWCGAGAPRFNIYTSADFSTADLSRGCFSGTHQDLLNGWTRVRFPAFVGPVFALEIVFDEGTDETGHGTPGSVTLDNIDVNGTIITNSSGTNLP
jgi:hypothetical protein